MTVSVTLTNTGDRDGGTVAQLYIHDVTASLSRPVQELKGFQPVFLKAGESKRVTFTLAADALKFYNQQMVYAAEPGDFEVMVGLDSARVKTARFTLL